MISPNCDRFHTVLLCSGAADHLSLANFNAMRQATFEYRRYPITV
jgi:hypothetical protein